MTAAFVVAAADRCFFCGTDLRRSIASLDPGGELLKSLVKRRCPNCAVDFYPAASIEQFERALAADEADHPPYQRPHGDG